MPKVKPIQMATQIQVKQKKRRAKKIQMAEDTLAMKIGNFTRINDLKIEEKDRKLI
jgi:hypothetical protein